MKKWMAVWYSPLKSCIYLSYKLWVLVTVAMNFESKSVYNDDGIIICLTFTCESMCVGLNNILLYYYFI